MIRAFCLVTVVISFWMLVPPYIESHYERKFSEKEQVRREALKEQICIQAVRWKESKCWWMSLEPMKPGSTTSN